MAIDLDIAPPTRLTKRTFQIPSTTADLLDRYTEAAKEGREELTENEVVTAILDNHFGRDRAFQEHIGKPTRARRRVNSERSASAASSPSTSQQHSA